MMRFTALKFFTLILSGVGIFIYYRSSPGVIPKYENTWWGPGKERSDADPAIKPFEIRFSPQEVDDLKARLNRTRPLTPPLEGSHWTYGISGSFLQTQVLNYWLNEYNIEQRLANLNQYNQFVTNIQGLDIHFIHVKPSTHTNGKRIIPLLISHGWPGSIAEFQKIIPLLTRLHREYDFTFEVIAPSLPGFGFSSPAVRPGLGSAEMAVVLKNLMLRLGFEQFYVQGGDWGAIITAQMAALFPEHVLGAHSNMCIVSSLKARFKTIFYNYFPSLLLPSEDQNLKLLSPTDYFKEFLLESGYFHIQATKPDTVGVGPSDSPAALAAYVLEKFSTVTNSANRKKDDGGLFEKLSPDVLIDNLMVYWISNSMTSAMRLYAESMSAKNRLALVWPVEVPSACAQFPHEIFHNPPSCLREHFKNMIQYTKMPRGGHFAALEEPELLANDVFAFVSKAESLKPSDKKLEL